jgi:hypothetical protein
MPPDFPLEGGHRTGYGYGAEKGSVTHRWRGQAQMRFGRKQMGGVMYIPRANRCLVKDRVWDAGLHSWSQLTLAVGLTNERGSRGGPDKRETLRETLGRRYARTSDGVTGWGHWRLLDMDRPAGVAEARTSLREVRRVCEISLLLVQASPDGDERRTAGRNRPCVVDVYEAAKLEGQHSSRYASIKGEKGKGAKGKHRKVWNPHPDLVREDFVPL